ncbi:hypothetical protein J6590_056985 [Homalodisca vitripennis]|nr:hypothetical protein J6590_056985 [Homalodisca vitripennis]
MEKYGSQLFVVISTEVGVGKSLFKLDEIRSCLLTMSNLSLPVSQFILPSSDKVHVTADHLMDGERLRNKSVPLKEWTMRVRAEKGRMLWAVNVSVMPPPPPATRTVVIRASGGEWQLT